MSHYGQEHKTQYCSDNNSVLFESKFNTVLINILIGM